ncbi:nicotinate-nucleotide--dimethylbenzimidazole phosphoribosyltransferase [Sporosarcina sp. NCCP-2716]|uniref:nicotinate-nucleotide--dimethylbenzimidazole phosphoribosyltransferase n=1 Tax=Sporosarcina sp. NCCP-2716 TaxID=2943679 RepID=UPI00203F83F7|nr:nicotinate-nucleotide--dimethylbenzimidazole phosphoribosyltransferase [Sporosarcina sp. NCCP-2716]GKV68251.1 nicotinate-nucleotide--dimethylbenzimidazole phosphoribosyltransferase [Sporosarcina sp. NCCP-2716]
MNVLEQTLQGIHGLDAGMMETARTRIDNLIKPVGSLGKLEDIAVRLSGITGSLHPVIDRKAIITMAADHGVYAEGISGNPQEITLAQTLLFERGLTGVCAIAGITGAAVTAVDIGIKGELPEHSGVIRRKVKHGTDNMAEGPAMTREEAIRSIEVGIEMAAREAEKGTRLIGTGEMGIGNTTPSTAMLAVFSRRDPLDITGRGAGVGEGGISHKVAVIRKAIDVNRPDAVDGLDVLVKVGGLEIGGMAGVMLGAAAHRMPVVIDGYISSVAALLAAALEPKAKAYFFASHASAEPGGKLASELLGLEPMLHMDMCLGEGSGAALAFPIFDAAVSMMTRMATFADVEMKI